MKDCDSDLDARKEMEDKSLVQHWDSVVNYVPDMSRIWSCLLFSLFDRVSRAKRMKTSCLEGRDLIGRKASDERAQDPRVVLNPNEHALLFAAEYASSWRSSVDTIAKLVESLGQNLVFATNVDKQHKSVHRL